MPRRWAFRAVTAKGYVDRVEIVADGQVIAVHVRSYGRREKVLDPLHFLVVLERKPAALAHARWLEREAKLLLPVEYHHVVFTLPAEVAELALANPALLYNALFQAASRTLRDVAANPKRLGAQVGILMVLHTWGQNLHHHPHVHAVVTGGGLSCDERGDIPLSPEWRSCRPGFFLPVRVLSRVFRGKFLALLQTAFDEGKLTFPSRRRARQLVQTPHSRTRDCV